MKNHTLILLSYRTVPLLHYENYDNHTLILLLYRTVIPSKPCIFNVSRYWQVFIPTVGVEYTSTHHADILCCLGPMMDEEEWMAKGLNNYGLIAVNSEGNAAQVLQN